MSDIVWPERYTSGITDNCVSNELGRGFVQSIFSLLLSRRPPSNVFLACRVAGAALKMLCITICRA